jgi:hypothetical protein
MVYIQIKYMKKILLLVLLISLTGCANQNLGADKKFKSEKLKAHKSKILHSQTVDECVEWDSEEKLECLKTKKVKQYHYNSGVKVPAKTKIHKGKELTEDISKRTHNSIHYKVDKDDNLLGAVESNNQTYIGHFYSGSPFVEDDGDWFQIEIATTSIENYEEQTATTTSVAIINFFTRTANAEDDSFYSGGGDGYSTAFASTWNTVHDITTGNGETRTNQTTTNLTVGSFSWGYFITHLFFPFDTSDLPDSATIESGTLNIFVTTKNAFDNDGYDFVSVVQGFQNSPTSLSTSDFDECGDSVDDPTEGIDVGERKDITNISTSNYLEFDLNATGLGWIARNGDASSCGSGTGWTCFGLREGHDILDISTGTATDVYNDVGVAFSNYTGTYRDPYLEITYSIGGGRRIINVN